MCYDSRKVQPEYDVETGIFLGLDGGDVAAGASTEQKYAGPTLRLPDEYRAFAKCMMTGGVERDYLVKYGVPFGKRVGGGIGGDFNEYLVKWWVAPNAVGGVPEEINPGIQFDVTDKRGIDSDVDDLARNIYQPEWNLMTQIIREGSESGEFDVSSPETTSLVIITLFDGLTLALGIGLVSFDWDRLLDAAEELIWSGVGIKKRD